MSDRPLYLHPVAMIPSRCPACRAAVFHATARECPVALRIQLDRAEAVVAAAAELRRCGTPDGWARFIDRLDAYPAAPTEQEP